MALSIQLMAINAYAAYCFAPFNPSVSSCNATEIQTNLKDGETVTLYEFVGNDKLKMTSIYPNSNTYITQKINETVTEFKRTGSNFQQTSSSGCVTKGLITETKETITLTEKSMEGNCVSIRMWEKYTKDKKKEARKIQY